MFSIGSVLNVAVVSHPTVTAMVIGFQLFNSLKDLYTVGKFVLNPTISSQTAATTKFTSVISGKADEVTITKADVTEPYKGKPVIESMDQTGSTLWFVVKECGYSVFT